MKKIAILNIKNFIVSNLNQMLTESEIQYDLNFFDDYNKEINCYNKKYITKGLHEFDETEYDIILNLSTMVEKVNLTDNQIYLAFDERLQYFDKDNAVKHYNIIPSCLGPLLNILDVFKKDLVSFDLIVNRSVASNGIEAMHSFFRESKDHSIQTVYKGHFFDEALIYNLHLKENDLKINIAPVKYNIKILQTSVIKVNTLIFYITFNKEIEEKEFIKRMDELDIEYKENIDAIKMDNEDYVVASGFKKLYDNKYSFLITFDDLRCGAAKYIYDIINQG